MTEDWLPFKVYPGILTPKQCERLIAQRGKKLAPAQTDYEDEVRIAQAGWFSDRHFTETYIIPTFRSFRRDVYAVNWPYQETERLHIVKYEPGGLYDWHADNEWKLEDDRKMSLVIALNDAYVGGGTEFMWPHPGKVHHVDLKPGDGVAFLPHLFHRGVQITEGERWVLVCWATGMRVK